MALGLLAALACRGAEGSQAGANGEWLRAPDATLQEFGLFADWSPPGRQGVLALTSGRVELDYGPAPTDIVSRPVRRAEDRHAAEATARWRTGEDVSPFLSAGGYRGFTDFRSVWLDEYYRQLFEVVPGYAKVNPRGWHALGGVRWAYLPGTAFLQGTVVWQQDRVSPGYEPQIGRPLQRGRERLATRGARLSLEAVLGPTVRTVLETGVTDTTGREPRWSAQGSLNWSVSEVWTARLVLAAVGERPAFHAESAAVSIERDWHSRWFVGVLARGYRDNGEVVDPLIVSSAAPAQRTRHLALTVRWQGERAAWRLEGGPYRVAYDSLAAASAHFARLYRDRHWRRLQGAATWRF